MGPHGERLVYRAVDRRWTSLPKLPEGLSLAAASDNGSRTIRSDGVLLDGSDNQLGNLAALVPFTHVVGGYGLSSGGRYGLVYGYRLVGTGSAQRATDGTLWVIDLDSAAGTGVASAPIIATIALPQAMGCTDALATGETCMHSASIAIAPGNGTAFLVGPRAVAAVPLPAAVNSDAPVAGSRKTVDSARQQIIRAPLRRRLTPASPIR